ncbi:MAG: hypothetical protein ACPG4M_03730 [Alphaproteobacteria bacterium]
MKLFIASIVALFTVTATASAGNWVSSSGAAVRSECGCILTSDGVNGLAECEEMMPMGPGKG